MTHLHLLIISLRIGAIVLVVHILQDTPAQFASISTGGSMLKSGFFWSAIVAPAILQLWFVILFWFFPRKIIKTLVEDVSDKEPNPEYFSNLSVALTIAIGVYLLSKAIPDLAYYLSLQAETVKQYNATLVMQDKASLVASVVEFFVGLALIFGSKKIYKMVNKLRSL